MVTTVTSTISQTGTPDYSTLQAWEDAAPASLVASDQIWLGEIQEATDHFAGTTSNLLTVSGITASSTQYVELTVKAGASFVDHSSPVLKYDESKGASISTETSRCILAASGYFRVSRIQFTNTSPSVSYLILINGGDANRITDCLLESQSVTPLGLYGGSVGTTLVTNVVGIMRSASQPYIIESNDNARKYLNCTFVVPSDVAVATNGVLTGPLATHNFVNCAILGCTNIVNDVTNATFTTCASTDASPPSGVTTTSFAQAAFESSVTASIDVRLTSDSTLIDAGTDDAGTATDIFGTTRPSGSYDVGAFEFSAHPGEGGVYLLLMGVG